MPRVSVLTATYNQARFVERCLESVRGQTFRDVEHVVVDDGSTDGTRPILETHTDIRYVAQVNAGNVASRNAALELSSGDLVAVLDGDDWWAPEKLERQVALMDADPRIGLVYTGMVEVDERGDVVSRPPTTDISDDPMAQQLVTNATPFSSMLIRREALSDSGLLDPRFNLVGDRYLTLQIALGGWGFACVSEPMLFLRRHAASMRYSPEYRAEYLRQTLASLDEVSSDSRLDPTYAGAARRGYAEAHFAAAWLMIDRGSAGERGAALAHLAEAVRRRPLMVAKAAKQVAKSWVRSVQRVAEGSGDE